MKSHVRLGVFFSENPQKQPDAKELMPVLLVFLTYILNAFFYYFLTKILSTGSLPLLILFTGILSLPRS